jgi:protein ImuA
MVLTRAVCRSPGAVVVVDNDRDVYPPALAAWGVPLERLIIIHAADEAGALWAADQALRCRATAAVWLRRDRLAPHDARRLQLAAEEGGTLGVLLRPVRVRGLPTWADVQLLVEPRPSTRGRRLYLEVTRCRGRVAGAAVDIEVDDVRGTACEVGHHETPPVSTLAELVGPAVAS